jgi:TonB family protein
MLGIKNNIVASVMFHALMFAAAFITGSSSELRKTRMVAVSLVEEWGNTSVEKQAAVHGQLPLRKTRGREVTSAPHVKRDFTPVAPESNDPTIPASESVGMQSLFSEANDIGQNDSPVHTTGLPTAGGAGSSAASGTVVTSQSNSLGGTYGTPAAGGVGQQPGSAGNASLRQIIRAALQANLVYPYIARKKQMEGSVMVSFRINRSGNPEAIRIMKGSGYSILDSAARETVVKASPFPAVNNTVEVPIIFTLKNN